MGASTVREILTRLWIQQLIHAEGQRGFEVASVSQAGLRDVAAPRFLLETQALCQSVAAGDLRWEADVVRKADAAVKLLINHIQSGLDLVLSTGRIPV